jgi:hypothetical protein
VIGVQAPLGQQLLHVTVGKSEKRKYQPTARRITSGSNWCHLNRPESEGTRSIGPAYETKPWQIGTHSIGFPNPLLHFIIAIQDWKFGSE